MFKNYLLAAWNILLKNKLYSAINLLGLGIGLAACLLITLFVIDELSYDKHWQEAESIYRMNTIFDNNGTGERDMFAFQSVVALPFLKDYFSDEIEFGVRVFTSDQDITYQNTIITQQVVRVDPDFLNIFQLEIVSGDLASTLEQTGRIALSEDVALRVFGRLDVVGEVFNLAYRGRSEDQVVTAIYRFPDNNTVLDVPAFTMLDVSVLPEYFATSWLTTGPEVYVKLADQVDPSSFNSRLLDFIDLNADVSNYQLAPGVKPSTRLKFEVQALTDVYLNSPWDSFHNNTGDRKAVYTFAAVAILLLLIACINFIILTTAKATVRTKEIAMRKTLGATRRQLFIQFIGESWFIVGIGLIIALALVELCLPVFNEFAGLQLAISFDQPAVYVISALLLVGVGLACSIYPALLLSSFSPARILQANHPDSSTRPAIARSALVVFQFSISIGLLIATAVIYAQIVLSMNRDIGFNKNNLMVVELDSQLVPQAEVLKEEMLRLPNVVNAGLSVTHPPFASVGYYRTGYYLPNASDTRLNITTSDIDEGFFDTYEIEIVAGRNYSPIRDQVLGENFNQDEGEVIFRNLVLNESAVRYLGFENPEAALGQYVFMPNLAEDDRVLRFTIIGVSADTQLFSLNSEPQPWMYHFAPMYISYLTLRYSGSPEQFVAQTSDVWASVMGNTEFNIGFIDQLMEAELRQQKVQGLVLSLFSILTIFIACLGLLGLVSFTMDSKTKEIGIRKVMGATIRQIVVLLLWQFSRPVLLANLFAWPVSVWLMLDWLQSFPYQISLWLLIPICLSAGLIALWITWLTVAVTTVQAANQNPVSALRYE